MADEESDGEGGCSKWRLVSLKKNKGGGGGGGGGRRKGGCRRGGSRKRKGGSRKRKGGRGRSRRRKDDRSRKRKGGRSKGSRRKGGRGRRKKSRRGHKRRSGRGRSRKRASRRSDKKKSRRGHKRRSGGSRSRNRRRAGRRGGKKKSRRGNLRLEERRVLRQEVRLLRSEANRSIRLVDPIRQPTRSTRQRIGRRRVRQQEVGLLRSEANQPVKATIGSPSASKPRPANEHPIPNQEVRMLLSEANKPAVTEPSTANSPPRKPTVTNSLETHHYTDPCRICLSPISNLAVLLPCGHAYDRCCVSRWTRERPTCPTCRRRVTTMVFNIQSENEYQTRPIGRKYRGRWYQGRMILPGATRIHRKRLPVEKRVQVQRTADYNLRQPRIVQPLPETVAE